MGSDIVFNSPYLDRYLRFGYYLDIIMLLLLRDTSLMFGPGSVMHMDDLDYTFGDRWFEVIRFSDLPYIYAILGYISLFGWDLYIFMEPHDPHHSWNAWRVDSLLLLLAQGFS